MRGECPELIVEVVFADALWIAAWEEQTCRTSAIADYHLHSYCKVETTR